MSVRYPDLSHSSFPNQEDNNEIWRDPSVSDAILITQYRSLLANGNRVAADELLQQNPTLDEARLNAAKLLKLQHGVIALQRYFFDNILDHIYKIGVNKGQWNE